MKKYNELKVYRIVDPEYDGCYAPAREVYTCRGEACDQQKSYYRGCMVKEERLLYTGSCPDTEIPLWRMCEAYGAGTTSWYTSQEEAQEAAERMGFKYIDPHQVWLNTAQIEPLEKEFRVVFQLDHNGRPYVRLDAHPERDGHSSKGKIFFPDRAFKGADLGAAMVSISKEFDTYGFLMGKMVPYEVPSMKDFLDWAWENKKSDTQVYFINHPGRGRYIAIEDDNNNVVRVSPASYEWSTQRVFEGACYEETVKKDVAQYTERSCTLTQLYLEDAWSMEVDLDRISQMFEDVEPLMSTYRAIGWEHSLKFWGETIEKARQNGFLTEYCVPGHQIELILVHPKRMDMLSYFTYNEVCEMASRINEINAAAKKEVKSRFKILKI